MDRFDAWLTKPRFSWLQVGAFIVAGVAQVFYRHLLPWWASGLAGAGTGFAVVVILGVTMGVLAAHHGRRRAQKG